MTTPINHASRPYISCKEVVDFMMAYVDRELDPETKSEFERHLGVCPSCVNYLDSYRRTIALGKQAHCQSHDPAEAGIPSGLVQAILAAQATLNKHA